MKALKSIYYIFDRLEDVIRGSLAKHPFIYTFVGGAGVVLFWRGVWHLADELEHTSTLGALVFSPTGSVVLSMIILLATGLFVSMFIGDSIIMSGIKKEKKVVDKTSDEIEDEKLDVHKTLEIVKDVEKELQILKDERKVCEG